MRVVGGVAANSGLRAAMTDAGAEHGFAFEAVPLRYCGDNAAMIAGAAALRLAHKLRSPVDVRSTHSLAALSEESR